MSEFFAEAKVKVRPDTVGFIRDLRKDVKSAIDKAGPFKVPLQFELKSFKKQIQNELKSAQFSVKVVANTSGFEQDLLRKTAKIVAPIRVVPIVEKQAVRAALAETAAIGAVAPRRQPRIPRDVASRATILSRAPEEKTGGGAEKQAKGEQKLSKAEAERQNILRSLTAAQLRYDSALAEGLAPQQQLARLDQARRTTIAAEDKALAQLAAAQQAHDTKLIQGLQPLQQSAASLRAKAEAEIASAEAKVKGLAVEDKATKVQTRAAAALQTNVREIKSRAALAEFENEVKAVTAELTAAETAAVEVNNVALAANVAQRKREILALEEEVVAQRALLKAEQKESRQRAFAARGAAANLLGLLGLRGAALAANAAFLAGSVAVATFAKSVQEFIQLERALNTFQAVTGATANQMENVSRVARQLGADITLPAVSATDAAEAMTELAKAGLDVNEAIAGSRGVLQLAAAAQIDNAQAAEAVAGALNAFGLAGNQAVHVADVLANAANASQGSIVDMTQALAQVSAVARQAGLSLTDTSALLTIFARNGLKGSDAGTSLRTALIRLIAPTKNASKFIEELGIRVRDTQGNIRPDVFAQFGKATEGLPPALRDLIAETIAGQDAIRAFAIGAREGTRGLQLAQLQAQQTGTAAAVAAARTKGLGGEFSALGSNLETLGAQIGKLVSGPISLLIGGLNSVVGVANEFAEGDFTGGLKKIADLVNPVNIVKTEFEGVRNVGEGIADLDFGRTAKGFGQLVGLVGRSKAKDEAKGLLEQLNALQQLRITQFQLRLPIGPITQDIAAIRARLKELHADTPDVIPLTPLDKAKQKVKDTVAEAQRLRDVAIKAHLDTSGLDAGIKTLQARLDKAGRLQIKVEGLEADRRRRVVIGLDTKQVTKEINDLRRQITEALKGIGGDAKKALTGARLAELFRIEFSAIADEPSRATPEVLAGIREMINQIGSVTKVSGKQGKKIGTELIKQLQAAIEAAVKAGDPDLAKTLQGFTDNIALLFGLALKASFKKVHVPITADDIAAIILPQDIKVAQAGAFGTVVEQITAAASREAALEKILKDKGDKISGRDRVDLLNQIKAEKDNVASLTKQQADDIQEASDKADQALLDSFGTEQQRIQNALVAAEGTRSLRDDVKFTRQLRDLYVREIGEAKTRIADAKKRNETLLSLQGDLIRANADLAEAQQNLFEQQFADREKRLNEALLAAQATATLADDIRVTKRLQKLYAAQKKQALRQLKDTKTRNDEVDKINAQIRELNRDLRDLREQEAERFKESLNLDVEFAQTKEDVAGEIKARQALIRELRKEQRQVRRGSVEWKRLRNEISEEKKAIDDLKKENEERRDSMRALAFSFLQAQQGFAANLLGNLIPQGATGGLVGNVAAAQPTTIPEATQAAARAAFAPGPGATRSPSEALRASQNIAAAAGTTGVTAGQASTMIKLLSDMVTVLRALNRGSSHPEAKNERQTRAASMDVMPHA